MKNIIIFSILVTVESTLSQNLPRVESVNGYDNFYLGNDYSESSIVTNPVDPLNSICTFIANPPFSYNIVYYTVDGHKWIKTNIAYSKSIDPVLCFNADGVCFYAGPRNQFPYSPLCIFKSTNKGANWSMPTVIQSAQGEGCDKWWITCDQTGGPFRNNLYFVWEDFIAGDSMVTRFCRSTDNGSNWSGALTLCPDSGFFPYVSVGANGNIDGGSVYAAYYVYGFNDTVSTYIHRSTNGGETFSNRILFSKFLHPGTRCTPGNFYLVKKCRVQANPGVQLAADNSSGPLRGSLYAVYSGRTNGNDSSDVFFVKSTNYGMNWSSPVKLTDDNTNTDQWMPAISVNNSGTIYVSWYDSRDDAANNLLSRLYGSYSTNGGLNFTSNQSISNTSFNLVNVAVNFGWRGFIGHYFANSPIGYTSLASWMDARYNTFGSFTGYFPDFALKTKPDSKTLTSNDSADFSVIIPAVTGSFSNTVKFSASLDSLPHNGNITYSFISKDSVTGFPDSIVLKVKTINVTDVRVFRLTVTGRGLPLNVPVHKRIVSLFVNTISVRKISSEVPVSFKLYQNYPNPFNPTTKIKFSIPPSKGARGMNVRLVIYDILGREVVTLVNEKLNPGTYEADWDGTNYPSGVYFYKLVTNSYSETKKMVLLK
jgi:Secretion system C-terminal sorting domain